MDCERVKWGLTSFLLMFIYITPVEAKNEARNETKPQDLNSLLSMAEKSLSQRKWESLQTQAESITQLIPTESWGYYYNGVAAGGLGKTEKALWLFDQALNKGEKLTEEQKAYLYYEKAKVLEQTGQKDLAYELFDKAHKNGVQSSDLRLYLALQKFNRGDCQMLLKEESLVGTKKSEDSTIALSECFALEKKTDKALKVLKTQLQYKKSATLYLQEARIYETFLVNPMQALKSYLNAASVDSQAERKAWIQKKINHVSKGETK